MSFTNLNVFKKLREVLLHYGRVIIGGMVFATVFSVIYAALKSNLLTIDIIVTIFTSLGVLYFSYVIFEYSIRFKRRNTKRSNPDSFAIIPEMDESLKEVEELKLSAREIEKSIRETQKQIKRNLIELNEFKLATSESLDETLKRPTPKSKEKKETDFVKTEFNFPDEIKAPAAQYLTYFAQFLQDLGIKASSTIEQDAGKILFSVTPSSEGEALEKIKEALAIYLNLPSSPLLYDESFPSMRLQQQVENLQHFQKMASREIQLAERIVESQNKIIQEKERVIDQQKKILEKITSKTIMLDSLENESEIEEVLSGIEVGESRFLTEYLGIKLNPAKVLKSIGKKIIEREDDPHLPSKDR